MLKTVLVYTLIPVAAVMLGGIIAAFRSPGARLRSCIQHFAAGIVFAAVALEILPDIMHERSAAAAVVGFVIGVALMLGVKTLTENFGRYLAGEAEAGEAIKPGIAAAQPTPQNKYPATLLITLGIDVLIDGLLIGLGFAAGSKQGVLLMIALTIEVMFLGLSAATAMSRDSIGRDKIIGVAVGLGLLLALGAVIGAMLLSTLSGFSKEVVLSLGAAALLYLVTEELLVEAHEEPETPLLTAMFFIGFVTLLVIEMLS